MPPAGSLNDEDPPSRQGVLAFWTTLPGVLTGAAAVITAMVGLLALWHPSGGGAAVGPASHPAAPAASAAVGPASHPAAPAASAAVETTEVAPATGILARGRLAMTTPNDADLEGGQVGNGVSGDVYLYCSSGRCLLTSMTGHIEPTDAAAVRSTCVAALKARQDISLDLSRLKRGSSLCLQTKTGHLAGLTAIAVPGVGSATFSFRYTVWK